MNSFSKKLIFGGAALVALFVLAGPAAKAQAACTASISWDNSSVLRGGSATETWSISGADTGTGGASCTDGHNINSTVASGLSFGPQSYTFNNIQYPVTCEVWGYSGGVQCSSGQKTVGLTCKASLTWDKTSVAYGGSATETWNVTNIDPSYGDKATGSCTTGGMTSTKDPLGPNGTYTFNNLTQDITCRVSGYIAGVQKCTDSAVVSVQAQPAGTGTGTINVVSYGIDSQLGGAINLPITWTMTGPAGFTDTVSTPVNKKTYQNANGGDYTISVPTVYTDQSTGIRYVLQNASPCGNATGTCTQTLTIPASGGTPVVNPPPPPPPVPNPPVQPVRIGDKPNKEVQLPMRTPGFRPLVFLDGWWKSAFDTAEAQTAPQISFALFYGPKAGPKVCGAACDPTLPPGKTAIGSLTVNPSLLYDGTVHTLTETGGVPNAPGALHKTIWEWDNFLSSGGGRTRAVGNVGTGASGWRTNSATNSAGPDNTPFQESAVPWVILDSSGNVGPFNRTASCADDGAGVQVKGFREEIDFLDYDENSDSGYTSPSVMARRDCRGTIAIHSDLYNPLGISWSMLGGWSTWGSDISKPIPVTNANVNNYNGAKFQGYTQLNANTIAYLATGGTYTMSNLPPNCSVDKPSQPVQPGQTTTYNIICNGYPGTGLMCTPNPSPATTGQPVTFTASGGSGSYTWTAVNGNPASGSGTNFTTTFDAGGQNSATLNSPGSGSVSCSVSTCPNSPTLVINPPSKTIPVSSTASYTALYDADGVGCGVGGGVDVTKDAGTHWNINNKTIGQNNGQGNYLGLKSGTAQVSATYNGLTATAVLNVNSTSQDFDCTVNPQSFTVLQGQTQSGTIDCSPLNGFTGQIDLAAVGSSLPQGSTMSITPSSNNIPPNPTTYNYLFTAGANTLVGAYTFQVAATSTQGKNNANQTLSHSLDVNPTIQAPPPQLSVALAVNPTSGFEPLNTTLTATVGQHSTASYKYYWWWNCTSGATTVAGTQTDCGAPNVTTNSIADPAGRTNQQTHTYNRGSYVPKVVVEQGTLSAAAGGAAGVSITVDPPPTHSECVANTCQQVPNTPGNSANRCSSNCDCGSTDPSCIKGGNSCTGATAWNANSVYSQNDVVSHTNGVYYKSLQSNNVGHLPPNSPTFWIAQDCGTSGDVHGACDAKQNVCVNVAGPGTSNCSTDPACKGKTDSHIICEGNACVIVGGAGSNDPGCSTVGASCTTPDTSGTCTIKANPRIIKQGDSSVITWSCTPGISKCDLLDPNGNLIARDGGSFSVSVNPSASTKYTLTCNRGTYQAPVSVYVVQSYKEVNPGGQ